MSSARSVELFSRGKLLIVAGSAAVLVAASCLIFGVGQQNGLSIAAAGGTLATCLLVGELIRSRLRWSLKVLLLAMTSSAVLLAVFGQHVIEAQRQQQAVDEILATGGTVYYSFRFETEDWIQTRSGWIIPAWVREVLGPDLFAEVGWLNLGPYADDRTLELLTRQLPKLESLQLHSTEVTSQGLVQLPLLKELDFVSLNGLQLDERSAQHLRDTQVSWLFLEGWDVEHKHFAYAAQLPSLRELSVRHGNLDGSGLSSLAYARQLEDLNVVFTGRLQDGALAQLAPCRRLQRLRLSGPIAAQDLRDLAGCIQLRSISIHVTLPSQAEAERFEEAATELRQKLPQCEIETYVQVAAPLVTGTATNSATNDDERN